MKQNKTSIIILNYNTAQLTFECILSIFEFESKEAYEIIVVDNASKLEDYNNLLELLAPFNQIKIVRSKINLGFGGGNMFGVQHASGDYLCFLNSDTLFVEPILDKLTLFANSKSDFGVAGLQILDSNNQKSISCRYFEGIRYKLLGKKFTQFTKKNKIYKNNSGQPYSVDFILGSLMFFDTKAFNLIGGFDTNIFLYYEETDICYRLKQNGFTTYFIPEMKYIHLEGKSSTQNNDLKLEFWISYFYVTRKNFGLFKYLFIKYFLIISYAFKAPFKKKNLFMFKNLLRMNESLALSLKHKQKINE